MADLQTQLIARVDAYCARTGRSRATLATKVAGDGKFFDRLDRGGTMTLRMYERFQRHLDAAEKAGGTTK